MIRGICLGFAVSCSGLFKFVFDLLKLTCSFQQLQKISKTYCLCMIGHRVAFNSGINYKFACCFNIITRGIEPLANLWS